MSWISPQSDSLQQKYVGTGTPDTTMYEFATNQHRDTCASLLGHNHMLVMLAMAENESIGRVKYNLLERMIQPCGPPPPKKDN
ncbi:MAG: putative splicing factor 3B subunit 5 [Streblomastix strix]|uniref:Putative splicing factor 3B subunit 5 n=1 Tax=Streblomastix strix TaxID=222440 RepID=A0A5J4VLJ5_9EUKA|nr:MAG: putative splicing factor 3B subunit 5 [Streblomastix strix]